MSKTTNKLSPGVYAIDPVDAGRFPFLAQQDEQPPVAEAPPPAGEIAQLKFGRPPGPIADRGAIGGDDGAGPPLRQAHRGLQMRDGFAPADELRSLRRLDLGGPYHFFDSSSRNAAASSICSARSFFSLAFSSSSAFSRFASDTSMPPNLAFQL